MLWELIKSPLVPLYKKVILGLLTLGYGLIPFDFLPLLPFDDILVALAAVAWFLFSARQDTIRGAREKEKTVDTDAEIID